MLRSFPLIVVFLLYPLAVSAQTPVPAKAPPRNVSIQVTFVAVSSSDLDAYGINFDLLPLPPSRPSNEASAALQAHYFLAFATGNIVPALYQTLTRTVGRTIIAAPVTAVDNSAVTVAIDAEVPAVKSSPATESSSLLPQLIDSLKIRGKLTFISQVQPDNTVTLNILSPTKGSQQIRVRTVPSGQQIVICASIIEKQAANIAQNQPPTFTTSQTRFTRDNAPELLIFITPTILPDAFTPPLSTSPSTSISIKPADFTEHTIGLQHTVANDVLKLMHWDGNEKIGSNSKLPNGVIRISVAPDNNSLLLQATPEGYSQVKNITKIVDVSRFEWTMQMQCWTADVQEKELAGLVFEKRAYIDRVIGTPGDKQGKFVTKQMEVASGLAVESLLQSLMAAKRTTVVPINYEAISTQQWSIGDMLFDSVRIQSDDTLAVRWISESYEQWTSRANSKTGSNLPKLANQLILHRNEAVILHSRENSKRGQIMFIKAEY